MGFIDCSESISIAERLILPRCFNELDHKEFCPKFLTTMGDLWYHQLVHCELLCLLCSLG